MDGAPCVLMMHYSVKNHFLFLRSQTDVKGIKGKDKESTSGKGGLGKSDNMQRGLHFSLDLSFGLT